MLNSKKSSNSKRSSANQAFYYIHVTLYSVYFLTIVRLCCQFPIPSCCKIVAVLQPLQLRWLSIEVGYSKTIPRWVYIFTLFTIDLFLQNILSYYTKLYCSFSSRGRNFLQRERGQKFKQQENF